MTSARIQREPGKPISRIPNPQNLSDMISSVQLVNVLWSKKKLEGVCGYGDA